MSPTAHLTLRFAPHRVNGWFLRLFALPYARVDGREHPCRWGEALTLDLAPGSHRLESFLRYRGTKAELGTGSIEFTAAPDDDLQVTSRNGWANHTPFVPHLR